MTDWISVNDSLPDKFMAVLMVIEETEIGYKTRCVDFGYYEPTHVNHHDTRMQCGFMDRYLEWEEASGVTKVLYWQPLPSLPDGVAEFAEYAPEGMR